MSNSCTEQRICVNCLTFVIDFQLLNLIYVNRFLFNDHQDIENRCCNESFH